MHPPVEREKVGRGDSRDGGGAEGGENMFADLANRSATGGTAGNVVSRSERFGHGVRHAHTNASPLNCGGVDVVVAHVNDLVGR